MSLATLGSVVALVCAPMVALGCAAGGATSEPPPANPTIAASDDEAELIEAIQSERARRGLPPALVYEERAALASGARMIRNGADPSTVLHTTLERLAESEHTRAKGWVLAAMNLQNVEYPAVFLEESDITLGVIVVRMPQASSAESPQYVVCLILVADGMNDEIGE